MAKFLIVRRCTPVRPQHAAEPVTVNKTGITTDGTARAMHSSHETTDCTSRLDDDHDRRRSFGAACFAFAAGVRFNVWRLAIVPEARYTRWGSSEDLNRKNEAAFLLGISF
jgi:hypothetical protein